ncbi:MAG: hypothetical protein QXJ72_06820 [Thermoproteota archaeon]
MSSPGVIDINELLNYATRIGVQAKLDGLAKAQLEGLLASLNMIDDPKASLLLTSTYAHRQAERLGRGRNTARIVNEAMRWLSSRGGDREWARMLLRFAKWVFECIENVYLPKLDLNKLTLEDFLKTLRGV